MNFVKLINLTKSSLYLRISTFENPLQLFRFSAWLIDWWAFRAPREMTLILYVDKGEFWLRGKFHVCLRKIPRDNFLVTNFRNFWISRKKYVSAWENEEDIDVHQETVLFCVEDI